MTLDDNRKNLEAERLASQLAVLIGVVARVQREMHEGLNRVREKHEVLVDDMGPYVPGVVGMVSYGQLHAWESALDKALVTAAATSAEDEA